MLMREVNHRVKNQYAVILSMIRETNKRNVHPNEFEAQVRQRIMSLARSHDLLVLGDWTGASLRSVIEEQLTVFGHADQLHLLGPDVALTPNAVQNLGMAFYELGTNSSKFGVLSSSNGDVTVSWGRNKDPDGVQMLEITWDESPVEIRSDMVAIDRKSGGFGSVVLDRIVPQSMNGVATVVRAEHRVLWQLSVPAAQNTVS